MNEHVEKLTSKINNKTAVIAVVGLGYVGLPTAVAFAEKGFQVIGADKNLDIIRKLREGKSHLTDLGIDNRVAAVINSGKLEVMISTILATQRSDIILICVPTPVHPDKTPDLYPVKSVGMDIASGGIKGKLIILESTVYPGLTEEVLAPILENGSLQWKNVAGLDFGLAHVPERYNPGDMNHSVENVVRVVGAINPDWLEVASLLYEQIVIDVCEVGDIKTAEAAKVIENIQRDLNIALMNELALIFERMDIDVMEVIRAAKTKWNFNTYYPGAGVGGHCLTTDPYYLTHKAGVLGIHSKIILSGRAVNDSMPHHILDLLIDALNEHKRSIKGSKIVVLGLAYKENIGDIRESPALVLIKELKKGDADLWVIDPYIETVMTHVTVGRMMKTEDEMYKVLQHADAIVIMTAHDEFRHLDLYTIKDLMDTPIIVDGRRIIDRVKAVKIGFTYRGVGAKNRQSPHTETSVV